MRKMLLTALLTMMGLGAFAIETVPIKGSIISPTDQLIQYAGRISFANPERPAWNFPGIQIVASFEGTSLRMIAKPRSGYFVAQIDQAEPFKVAFRGERDSVVTLATALPNGVHTVKLMYAIEGYEFYPEFWGFVLDKGKNLVETPALPSRKIEFIGNSITCGYGNEGLKSHRESLLLLRIHHSPQPRSPALGGGPQRHRCLSQLWRGQDGFAGFLHAYAIRIYGLCLET